MNSNTTKGGTPAVESVLVEISTRFGEETLLQNDRLLAIFADLAPQLEKERRLLRAFLECGGNRDLLGVKEQGTEERRFHMDRVTHWLVDEFFLTEDAAGMICTAFAAALWDEVPTPAPKKRARKQKPAPARTKSAEPSAEKQRAGTDTARQGRSPSELRPMYFRGAGGRIAKEIPVLRTDVEYIEFLDSTAFVPAGSRDVSRKQDGSVLAWVTGAGDSRTLFFAGEGGVAAPRNCGELFKDYKRLKSIRFNGAFHTETSTGMREMFADCKELTQLDLSCFDTAGVKTFAGMFKGCGKLTRLELGSFCTAQATDFSNLFQGCFKLAALDLSGFDTGRAETMERMFEKCRGLKTLDLRGFRTARVRNMARMFADCTGLTGLELSGLDTIRVETMEGMFTNCRNLRTLDVRSFCTGSVRQMSSMFENCERLTALDLRNFEVQKTADVSWMFRGCSALREVDLRGVKLPLGLFVWSWRGPLGLNAAAKILH